jgi:glycosyltransferase involved in cell wall biosynthesis
MPLVTVSIPTHNCADTLRTAVESVLSQTMTDLVCVVGIDGDKTNDLEALSGITDSRLQVVQHDRNRGRYAIDHDVATTCDSTWFTVCDADDFVDPHWLETMLSESDGVDVVMAPHWLHPQNGEPFVVPITNFTGDFHWHAHMGACLFSTSWVRQYHATCPSVRVGWDNVMTALPFIVGDMRQIDDPTYHRVRRLDSLTTSHTTGMGSPLRRATTTLIRNAWLDIYEEPENTACVVASLHTDRTAEKLIPQLPHNEWTMHEATLYELDAYLWREQPRTIVECGSGLSTVVLARYALFTGATVLSLEHQRNYYNQTRNLLQRYGVESGVKLTLCDLVGSPPMYDHDIPEGVDFLLIDGPPEATGGRASTLPAVLPYMATGWQAWLDDSTRVLERTALQAWKKEHKVATQAAPMPRDVTRIQAKRFPTHSINADGVVLAILTGWRPDLLRHTLSSLPTSLLRSAHVIVLHDGGDDETTDVLSKYEKHIDEIHTRQHPYRQMHTIGENWSHLSSLTQGKGDYVLMLEDDWQYSTLDHHWLDHARSILSTTDIAQVRLRHVSERNRPRHMVTGEHIDWTSFAHGMVAHAHLGWQPNLMHVSDLTRTFPAEGERHWQSIAYDEGLRCVAQLYPAVFRHIGDEDSLRKQLHSPA